MPKSHPRRNATEAKNGRFRQVFALEPDAFSRKSSFRKILEMAVGERAAARSPCPARPETSGATFPAMMVPIEVTATPASSRGLRERLKAILRDRAQNLVIVAAGNDGLDADGAAREQCRSGRRQRNARRVDRRPTRRRPRTAWRDRRRDHRTHPSPRWRDREPPAPARCAAAERGSARPASALPRHRRRAPRRPRRPCRISRPSAASPIVPVTTTRSPGLRAAAMDHLARGRRARTP